MGYIGMAWESSGNVPNSTPQVYCAALSEEISPEFERYERYNIINQLSEPDDKTGVLGIEGEIEAPFEPISGGFILTAALGSATVSSFAGGMWLHSWKTPRNSFWDPRFACRPVTLEIFRDVTSAQQYSGGQCGGVEFSVEPNGDLIMTSQWLALSALNKASGVASYSGIDPFAFEQASLSVNDAAYADMEAWSYNIDSQLEAIATLSGRRTAYKIRRSDYPVSEGEFSYGFEDITMYQRYMAETEFFQTIAFQQGSHQLHIIQPRIKLTSHPLGMGGRERQVVDAEYKAYVHPGSATSFEIKLITTVGSFG
jgi:hypothetical protein